MENILLTWNVMSIEDISRVTAMYCFKNCSVNEN